MIMTVADRGTNEIETLARRAALIARGAQIEDVSASESASAGTVRLSLPEVLDRLGRREVNELWVEAGPRLAGALLEQSLADELLLYVAPKLLGPTARSLADIAEVRELKDAPRLTIIETQPMGEDLRLRLRCAAS